MAARVFSLVCAALLALVTVLVSLTRFIARDEGFYLYAAKLIMEGQVPYRDFFLPQMPLMTYLYAGWFAFVGVSWVAARILAAAIALLCMVMTYLIARRVYDARTGQLAVVMIGVSAAFQVWMPLAKNMGLASLLFLLALYYSLVRQRHALAGLCMGFCVLSRLTFAPLALLLVIPRTRSLLFRQTIAVALGMLPALALAGWWYGSSPENFVLHNIDYHFQRTRLDEEGIADNKQHVLLSLLGLRYCVGGGGRQFVLLLIGTAASLVCTVRGRFEHRIIVASAALFFALNFIPSPTYVQYFCVVALLAAAPAAHTFLVACDQLQGKIGYSRIAAVAMLLGLGYFTWLGSLDMYRYLYSGEKVIGVGARNSGAWRLGVPGEVAEAIDQLNQGHKPVYVSWPGYLLEARSSALSGTENHFGVGWANFLGVEGLRAKDRRVLGRKEIVAAYEDGSVDVIALFRGRGRKNELEHMIEARGALKVKAYKGVVFYTRGASKD